MYIKGKVLDSFRIVMSRKLIVLSISFSIVNFIVGIRLLKELKNSSMSVMELYAISILSTYRKYPRMLFRISTSYVAVCSTCCR